MFVNLKGVFARSRRDFTIAQCAIAGSQQQGLPVGNVVSINLFNNSVSGASLAVYGILAFVTSADQMVYAQPNTTASKSAIATRSMVDPSAPQIDGILTSNVPAIGSKASAPLIFPATGNWFVGIGGDPLFILPPKWALSVGSTIGGATLTVCYVWGLY